MLCQSTVSDLNWQAAGCDSRIAAVTIDRDKYKAQLDAAIEKLANCTSKLGRGGGRLLAKTLG